VALTVVKYEGDGNGATVVLECTPPGPGAIEELQGVGARELALQEAARNGLAPAGISSPAKVFPVGADGQDIVFPPQEGQTLAAPVAFRGEIKILRSF